MIFLDKNKNNHIPIYEQLFEELRQSILKGELDSNTKLKPIRVLAEELNVSNNTVNRAYQQLMAEGYIKAIQGSGYYVEQIESLQGKNRTVTAACSSDINEPLPKLKYDFKYDSIETASFPWSKWRRYMNMAIVEEAYSDTIAYESNKGNLELRETICDYIGDSRGVKCSPEQIIICPGTQFAVDIITNILPERRYQVGVEDPGYGGMKRIFSRKNYKIVPIPMTQSGINIEQLKKTRCRLLYLTPSHQFPTGITTSMKVRTQLLDWARENQAYIIENDYDNEFSYGKRHLPSLQSMDKDNNVIYISTLSKVLSPSLRCAYCVLPPGLLKTYEFIYNFYYSSLPTYNQRALSKFIKDGHLERHVRKMSLLNRRKNEIFNKVMKEWLPDEVSLSQVPAGAHVLVKIQNCINQKGLIEQMRERGIGIYGTKEYWCNARKAPENLFLLGYNSIPEEELEEACIEFACALKEIR